MHLEKPLVEFAPLNEQETLALELRWYEGALLAYVEWLLDFVAKHREEILYLANESGDPGALLVAVKLLIAECGSLHLADELQDQRHQIQNELWYRAEKGEQTDFDRVAQEWTEVHAGPWRLWRLKEYFFTAERCAALLSAYLAATAQSQGRYSPPREDIGFP